MSCSNLFNEKILPRVFRRKSKNISHKITFGTYTLTNRGNSDMFLVKYDVNKNVMWAKSGGGAFDDVGLSIVADANRNVYVIGYFYSPVFTYETFTLTNNGDFDFY